MISVIKVVSSCNPARRDAVKTHSNTVHLKVTFSRGNNNRKNKIKIIIIIRLKKKTLD